MEYTHREEHESFALVQISKVQSSHGVNLFGSSMKHRSFFQLTISRAVKERNLNTDWYHGREELIQVYLSPAQFAEMITSQNQGEGNPCTLHRLAHNTMEACPQVTKRQELQSEFEKHMKEITCRLKTMEDTVQAISDKPSAVTKKDRAELVKAIYMMKQEVNANLPFMRKCYEESITKSVTEAKCEIESYLATRGVSAMGLHDGTTTLDSGDAIR